MIILSGRSVRPPYTSVNQISRLWKSDEGTRKKWQSLRKRGKKEEDRKWLEDLRNRQEVTETDKGDRKWRQHWQNSQEVTAMPTEHTGSDGDWQSRQEVTERLTEQTGSDGKTDRTDRKWRRTDRTDRKWREDRQNRYEVTEDWQEVKGYSRKQRKSVSTAME